MAYIQAITVSPTASATTTAATLTGVGAGNTIVAIWAIDDNTGTPGTPSAAGGGGDGWAAITNWSITDGTNLYAQRGFINRNVTGGNTTVTITHGTCTTRWLTLFEVSEVPGAGAIGDHFAASSQTQSPPPTGADGASSGNATPVASPWLQIGFCVNWAGGTPVAGTGFTTRGQNWDFGGDFSEAESRTGTGTSATAATFARGANGVHFTSQIVITQGAAAASILRQMMMQH